MNVFKLQTDNPPTGSASPDSTMAHGIPSGMKEPDAKGTSTSDCSRTETVLTDVQRS